MELSEREETYSFNPKNSTQVNKITKKIQDLCKKGVVFEAGISIEERYVMGIMTKEAEGSLTITTKHKNEV